MNLVSLLMSIAFSAIGLGLMLLSRLYLQTGGYRTNAALLEYAAENGVKEGYERLKALIAGFASPQPISEAEYLDLKAGAKAGSSRLAERILGLDLPQDAGGGWDRMTWNGLIDWEDRLVHDSGNFILAEGRASIQAEGILKDFRPKRRALLEIRTGIAAGYIPLAFFAFLIDKDLKTEEKTVFMERHNIMIKPDAQALPSKLPRFSNGELIPGVPANLLEKSLKIKFFKPDRISLDQLRRALGLEIINEPVPEGVYLIQDSLGLGGIYIQGDVEEMGLAVEGEYQVISFRTAVGDWILKFSPIEEKTVLKTPEETRSFDRVPLGIVIVSGEIKSLGGDVAGPDGMVVLAKEEAVESVLRGLNLTIVSSGEITVTSHLVRQGVQWMNEVPYLDDQDAKLMIFSGGKSFIDGGEEGGGITIGEGAPDDLKIQASLTAGGEGFKIKGAGKSVLLAGGLQAADYQSAGNSLTVLPAVSSSGKDSPADQSPLTRQPILHLALFEVMQWKDIQ